LAGNLSHLRRRHVLDHGRAALGHLLRLHHFLRHFRRMLLLLHSPGLTQLTQKGGVVTILCHLKFPITLHSYTYMYLGCTLDQRLSSAAKCVQKWEKINRFCWKKHFCDNSPQKRKFAIVTDILFSFKIKVYPNKTVAFDIHK
jgi:hypothetical protein